MQTNIDSITFKTKTINAKMHNNKKIYIPIESTRYEAMGFNCVYLGFSVYLIISTVRFSTNTQQDIHGAQSCTPSNETSMILTSWSDNSSKC